MRIFALETDLQKTTFSLKGRDEPAILFVQRHWFPLIFAGLRIALLFAVVLSIAIMLGSAGLPALWISAPLLFWMLWSTIDAMRTYIDWRYTFLFMTDEKLVFVEQHLWISRTLTPITLNNILSVTIKSQFWEMFPFGSLHVHLRDPGQSDIRFNYAPHPQRIARKIAKVVTSYNHSRSPIEPERYSAHVFSAPELLAAEE